MGQYHKLVCLDRREFINPHGLGCGLKQWEILANDGVGRALVILFAHPDQRGGGDFDVNQNWHGPERVFPEHNVVPGPMPEEYMAVAKRTIGRWRGCRVAMIGDYAEDGDLTGEGLPGRQESDPPEGSIYSLCQERDEEDGYEADEDSAKYGLFTDITDDIRRVIEHELKGVFCGNGWLQFHREGENVAKWKDSVNHSLPRETQQDRGKIVKASRSDGLHILWEGHKTATIYPLNGVPYLFVE